MENKYYTPAIEDIRVGYECEVSILSFRDGYCWKHYIYPDGGKLPINLNGVRTPYLTKEQIEAEGWKWDEPQYKGKYSKKSKRLDGVEQVFELQYDFQAHILCISYDCGEFMNCFVFEGKCPSINEFRTITKLLGI